MREYTKDEALVFIDAMRLTISGKVGFKWMVDRLSDLTSYIVSVTSENEQLNAYLDSANAKEDYESYCATHPEAVRPQDPESGTC